MINYIICDDNKDFLKKQKAIIDNFMMNYDIDYKCFLFTEYDDEFNKTALLDSGFKIFLLDIQTKKGSGLDAARIIREAYDDWVSVILIITAFNEFKYEALENRLYLLDFINKLNNYEEKIKEDLERALKHYNKRDKSLKYEYNHILKQIEFRHIIFIEKEPDSKRCRIKTTYGEQIINKNLTDTYKLLDERFIKTSRSMIINVDQISEYNLISNKVIFKSGDYTYQVSRGMKKELKKVVGINN